jgi:hypothetical protein
MGVRGDEFADDLSPRVDYLPSRAIVCELPKVHQRNRDGGDQKTTDIVFQLASDCGITQRKTRGTGASAESNGAMNSPPVEKRAVTAAKIDGPQLADILRVNKRMPPRYFG